MKKQTIKLSDVRWAYSEDGEVVMPLILNNSRTKLKDLNTNEIYEGAIDSGFQLNKSISALLTQELGRKIKSSDSPEMLSSFGVGQIPCYCNFTLHKFDAYLRDFLQNIPNCGNTSRYTIASYFCRENPVTIKQVQKLSRTLSKLLQYQYQSEHKKPIDCVEDEKGLFEF